MAIILENRSDFTLQNYTSVAWAGDSVHIQDSAVQRIDICRSEFLQLLEDDPELHIYGVTSGYGQNAHLRLDRKQRQEHAAMPPLAAMSGFGGQVPERVKRGIVFARLANFIGGHAAVSSGLALRVAKMLDDPLPQVPLLGNASAGEIIPLSHLFVSLGLEHDLGEKETLSLINGSPCASALLADIALSTEKRLLLALDIFALSIEALGAPLEAYDEHLEHLYADNCTAWALQELRQRIDTGKDERRDYQAPVSWRITPQVLAQGARAHRQLLEYATTSLAAVTDNPVVVPSTETDGSPRVLSNGGYHNGGALMAMDAVTGSYADLALLCDRQISKLFDGNVSGLPPNLKVSDGYLGCAGFVAADYAEQARRAAERTSLIGSEGGGFGQNDVLIPVFHAWRKNQEAGRALDATLAILAVTCSQAFHASDKVRCPEQLQPLLEEIRFLAPPLTTARAMGASIGDIAERFTQRVFDDCAFDN